MKKIFAALSILAVLGMSLPAMADDAAAGSSTAPATSSAPAKAKKSHKHAAHHGKHMKKKAAAPADNASK